MKDVIREKLFELKDPQYLEFHAKLCPGVDNIIGIRIPVIRELCKSLLKEYSFEELYNNIGSDYYEEIMLRGVLIGMFKGDFDSVSTYIKEFIPLIDNWAICDTFCAGLKITKKNMKEMRKLILSYKESAKEFELRFMLVMILDYYITEEYLNDNFKIFDSVKSSDYYVSMALAWAISVCLIKYYDETITYLKNSNLSDFVYNKALQKARESFRISDDKKIELKDMKR